MADEQPARREVVTAGRGTARTGMAVPTGSAAVAELDPEVESLIHRQLWVGLRAAAVLLLLVAPLPLLLGPVTGTEIAGVGITWIVLGVAPFPVLLLLGRWYVGRVERNEARFRLGG